MTEAHSIAENVAQVRQRIAQAAVRSGRTADAVTLVAVTKYADLDAVGQLVDAECLDLGESRPQQLWERAENFSNRSVRWHLIGHLQRNKVPRTIKCASLIHSADSLRLIEACDREAAAAGLVVRLLLEVNISGDAAKHGFRPDELAAVVQQLPRLTQLRVKGLMAMAGIDSTPDEARRQFAALRQLRDQLQAAAPPSVELRELSMGMSGDFEAAIEEGATIVRIGEALR